MRNCTHFIFCALTTLLLLAAKTGSTMLFVPGDVSTQQMGVGAIEGKLMGNLEIVAGVDLVLMQKDKVIATATSDENGYYRFLYVNPGHYDVKASKTGYRTAIIVRVPVAQDETTPNSFYIPKYNDRNMPAGPAIDDYEHNRKKYMRMR